MYERHADSLPSANSSAHGLVGERQCRNQTSRVAGLWLHPARRTSKWDCIHKHRPTISGFALQTAIAAYVPHATAASARDIGRVNLRERGVVIANRTPRYTSTSPPGRRINRLASRGGLRRSAWLTSVRQVPAPYRESESHRFVLNFSHGSALYFTICIKPVIHVQLLMAMHQRISRVVCDEVPRRGSEAA